MRCSQCDTDTPVEGWGPAVAPHPASHSSDEPGRACPVCGHVVSHIILDGILEWRHSPFYRSGLPEDIQPGERRLEENVVTVHRVLPTTPHRLRCSGVAVDPQATFTTVWVRCPRCFR